MTDLVEQNSSKALHNKEPVYTAPIGSLDEDAELLFVRNVRLEVIRQQMKDGKVPEDPEAAEILIKALKDMDQSALTRKKLKSDEQNNQSMNNAAALLAEALKSVNGNTGRIEKAATKVIEEIPEHLKKNEFTPGLLDQGTVNETYDEFMRRMG